ncbi:hypothetical protein [Microbulbifer celer]|uniref:Uncharacterized protein n=1 Tax=Microbulbifer celer TaxID=435905 RepID=A0ABW3U8S8_9GAMM|nr:hypothetical protein [Microbulbifer celer]UFN56941.1 hypothetical protein LPW13_15440 [Microbulbifer celer]
MYSRFLFTALLTTFLTGTLSASCLANTQLHSSKAQSDFPTRAMEHIEVIGYPMRPVIDHGFSPAVATSQTREAHRRELLRDMLVNLLQQMEAFRETRESHSEETLAQEAAPLTPLPADNEVEVAPADSIEVKPVGDAEGEEAVVEGVVETEPS